MQQRPDRASQARIFFGYTVWHRVMTAVDYFAGLPLVIFLLRPLVYYTGDILVVGVVLAKVMRVMVVLWRICRGLCRIPPRFGCLTSPHGACSQHLTKSIKSRVRGDVLIMRVTACIRHLDSWK